MMFGKHRLNFCTKENQALTQGEKFKAKDVLREDLFYEERQEKYNSQFVYDCEALLSGDSDSMEYTFRYLTPGICGVCDLNFVPPETECELQAEDGWTSARWSDDFAKVYNHKFATNNENEFNNPEKKSALVRKRENIRLQRRKMR